MTAIERYLHSEVAVMKKAGHNTLNGYATLSDFVLKHGHLFDLAWWKRRGQQLARNTSD